MKNPLPKHVAIIMDGNGRWAEAQGLPRMEGHQAGSQSAKKIIEYCAKAGISTLTLFAFGVENYQRPSEEVDFLMGLFLSTLQNDTEELYKNNISIRIIGDRTRLNDSLQHAMQASETLTAHNSGLQLNVAINYSGRWDIVQAAQRLVEAVQNNTLRVGDIEEKTLRSFLSTAHLTDPDLLIRTSGEQRISNFMLWQFAYTELYFSPLAWPDFNETAMEEALKWFQTRHRRFGLTQQQLDVYA